MDTVEWAIGEPATDELPGPYRQHSLFRQEFLHDATGLVFPFRQLALKAVVASGHADKLAHVAGRDELIMQRDGLGIGHGRVGIAVKDQYRWHFSVELMHGLKRLGFVAKTLGRVTNGRRSIGNGADENQRDWFDTGRFVGR